MLFHPLSISLLNQTYVIYIIINIYTPFMLIRIDGRGFENLAIKQGWMEHNY